MVSLPIDFASCTHSTGLLSLPIASIWIVSALLPRIFFKNFGSQAANCPIVKMPSCKSPFSVFSPIPKIFLTGSGAIKSLAASSRIITKPFGFSKSEASLAKNLFGAMPTDAVRPVFSFILSLIASPALLISSPMAVMPVISRNASSMESGSMQGENSLKIAIMFLDISTYLDILP